MRVLWIVCLATLALAGCSMGSSATSATPRLTSPQALGTSPAPAPAHHPRRRHHHRHRAGPPLGSLPQTNQRPSASSPLFRREMAALWRGVRRGSVPAALPAFFPVRAYLQVKTIGHARGDWTKRLVSDFRLDLEAAHGLLGAGARSARLLGVRVPSSYAHWVPPGACSNRVGYWEVPNARVVYREHGQVHSFGIASMISWRGVWYVVHLGAVLRTSPAGVVDSPSPGAGVSAYSGTC